MKFFFTEQHLETDTGNIAYDYLVLALRTETSCFGMEGVAPSNNLPTYTNEMTHKHIHKGVLFRVPKRAIRQATKQAPA